MKIYLKIQTLSSIWELMTNLQNLVDSKLTNNDFDDLGIGAVRVVSSDSKVDVETDSVSETTEDIDVEPIRTTNTAS